MSRPAAIRESGQIQVLGEAGWDDDASGDYLCIRLADTLLRENVRECVSRGEIVGSENVSPHAVAVGSFAPDQRWLKIQHFGSGVLWIPVTAERFMQPWRLTRLPLVWQEGTGTRVLRGVAEVLACFRQGLDDTSAKGFEALEEECTIALAHRGAAEAECERWFVEWRASHGGATGVQLDTWHERHAHYDRLASFLDHPFYPTARAKAGFPVSDLGQYAPEFRKPFRLNWLAVPRGLYWQHGRGLPPCWPGFAEVGLPEALNESHVLVPVHPFTWRTALDRLLDESGLASEVVRAPRAFMAVAPTLSVRTVELLDDPRWHLKLPLPIRTLGARNIRLIKPSTIEDGHTVQTLLGAIVEREPTVRGKVLLTEEGTGAHVAQKNFLGFIVRHYPSDALAGTAAAPVAAFAARTPGGEIVFEELAARFYRGDLMALFEDYVHLTLDLHLRLWVRYGVALESNQQNTVVVLGDRTPRLRLLLKDNDAARILGSRFAARFPEQAPFIGKLRDDRIRVTEELPLAQMFTTITLQLNIAAFLREVAGRAGVAEEHLCERVRHRVEAVLEALAAEGEDTAFARRLLLEEPRLYVKYLLTAATLSDKTVTGAADVNKYYGDSAPNFLTKQP